jgi:hypothetical protein
MSGFQQVPFSDAWLRLSASLSTRGGPRMYSKPMSAFINQQLMSGKKKENRKTGFHIVFWALFSA